MIMKRIKTLTTATAILTLTLTARAEYMEKDFQKFLSGTHNTEKEIREVYTYKNTLKLYKTAPGTYEIRDRYGYRTYGTRQDINLNDLAEIRTVKANNYMTNYKDIEYAKIHMTREQRKAFRENPEQYIEQLNKSLREQNLNYTISYRMINQKNPRTGKIEAVPKPILIRN